MTSIREVDITELFKGKDYGYLLGEFGEDKIKDRFRYLYDYLCTFITANQLDGKVHISVVLLEQVIVDYFVDIYRLKHFHHIEKINEDKIHAYTAYWLAMEKVLQVNDTEEKDNRMSAVNEWMVVSYLISYLYGEDGSQAVYNEANLHALTEFKNNLQYSLRYRQFTAYMIETILIAFKAGQSWQNSHEYIDAGEQF